MRRKERVLVKHNTSALKSSNRTLKDIFDVMFGDMQKDNILAEENTGYRIKKYTYEDVKKMINDAAASLYDIIGASHGYVALEMENCVEWIVSFWAILKSGNKPYLVNCRHTKSLSDSALKTLGIKYTVCLGKSELECEKIDIKELQKTTSGECLPEDLFENEIALSTSATTMRECICIYTGREISEQILNASSILTKSKLIPAHVDGSLKLLAFLPFYHVFGLVAVYFWFTYFGRCLVFLRDYMPDTILKTCRAHRVTHVFAVPMLWHTMEKEVRKKVHAKGEKTEKKFDRGLLISEKIQRVFPYLGIRFSQYLLREVTDSLMGNSIRCCISGGSYINDSTLKFFNCLGYPLHNGYGMSEIGITSVELGKRTSDREKNSVGFPFNSVEYKISERGTLLVKGDSICKKMIVDGNEITPAEWFDTGDIARKEENGYYIDGRSGDIVIGENGENVNPDVIERSIDTAGVDTFCVLGLEKDGVEELSLVIKVSEYFSAEKLGVIIERVYSTNELLPSPLRIKRFYFTNDDICAENAIKVSRTYLKNLIACGKVRLVSFADVKNKSTGCDFDPDSAIAKKVRSLICEVLSVDEDSVKADTHIVNDLGATSLQYFMLLSKMIEEFPIGYNADTDALLYTLSDICDYIERHL